MGPTYGMIFINAAKNPISSAFLTPRMESRIVMKIVIVVTWISTPIKYLISIVLDSPMACMTFFSCLSGTTPASMVLNRPCSFKKKNEIKRTDSKPIKKFPSVPTTDLNSFGMTEGFKNSYKLPLACSKKVNRSTSSSLLCSFN